MEMIEHVARAIAAQGGSDWDKLPATHGPGFGMRQMYENMARAAIDALREPTSKMIEAGAVQHELEFCIPGHPNPDLSAASQCWRGMIDAALSDA